MCKVINLADYRKAKEEDVHELIRIVKSFPYNNKDLEKQSNYYLKQYLRKINF
ncbi:hypothetical protein [Clostridium sporogenes]|uniref:hypothetical protein n=1 Tax=Clostridium sporogenes TaxID=1509 RepID=UPI000729A9BD|nr:hypothetical protein [Clostridium sporogenes]KRU40628.1 hypothetical protein VT94_22960 [Clostridium sporogenes]MBY7066484.1 hypothetical protein [Clostridium sporogenes]MBY7069167.1 hypothetical protein [Clostridium sporogenes]MCW6065537.1 hypothetical protein [Clostridium sporogenes]OQP93585.1 hypothetical protein VT93_0216520 [Clostridium sporogenes]